MSTQKHTHEGKPHRLHSLPPRDKHGHFVHPTDTPEEAVPKDLIASGVTQELLLEQARRVPWWARPLNNGTLKG